MARAQTALDFLIGVSVFLLVVSVTFTMVPGIIEPFTGGRDASALVADRAANQLGQDVLAKEESPYVLNETAVDRFFNSSRTNESDVKRTLALGDVVSINVTLTNATATRAVGETPPNGTTNVYAAWRVVSIDGERADLRVRVW